MVLLILSALIFLSTSTAAKKNAPAKNLNLYFVAGCKILDDNFKVIRILSNDWICLPLKNGSWIASNERSRLTMYDPMGTLQWNIDGHFHHRIEYVNDKSIIAMKLVEKESHGKQVLYDEILKIDIMSGKTIAQFSLYEELNLNRKTLKPLDRTIHKLPAPPGNFTTAWEKLHLNSISFYKNEYIINDIALASFILDENLKFKRFMRFPKKILKKFSQVYHDLQQIGPDHYLVFENFHHNNSSQEKSFKIYEFKNDRVIFEFPTQTKDFVKSDYSGGVSKIGDIYLVGFPLLPRKTINWDQRSFVGLIDSSGQWIRKAILPFRIQEIKPLQNTDFLKFNLAK